MNKQQIKAELRRSACEDKDPAYRVSDDAYNVVSYDGFLSDGDPYSPYGMSDDEVRTFFLLVAEAL